MTRRADLTQMRRMWGELMTYWCFNSACPSVGRNGISTPHGRREDCRPPDLPWYGRRGWRWPVWRRWWWGLA